VVAQRDVAAVVTMERRFDLDVRPTGRDQLPDQAGTLGHLVVAGIVQLVGELPGAAPLLDEPCIARVVGLAREHAVLLGLHVRSSWRAVARRSSIYGQLV